MPWGEGCWPGWHFHQAELQDNYRQCGKIQWLLEWDFLSPSKGVRVLLFPVAGKDVPTIIISNIHIYLQEGDLIFCYLAGSLLSTRFTSPATVLWKRRHMGSGGRWLQPAIDGSRAILSMSSSLMTSLVLRIGGKKWYKCEEGSHNQGQRTEWSRGPWWEAIFGIVGKMWLS